ncbi:MAG: alpha/beta fold hydrolase [Chloroflexi bacterium]|nr:alpha/beta fold hydrolase [Chloroflexota bacterium]
MRAVEPNQSGKLKLEGYQIGFETFGDPKAQPVLLLPTWQIVHSRHWKMQVPFLARSFYVITYDGPGSGGGERADDLAAYQSDRIVDQGIGLLDHLGVNETDVIGFSRGSSYGIWLAARYPERVNKMILIGNFVTPGLAPSPNPDFQKKRKMYDGWEKYNAHYWRENYKDFLEFFFGEFFSEAHSTKGFEDCVGWGLETTSEFLIHSVEDPVGRFSKLPAKEAIEKVRCPVLLIHGSDDRIVDIEGSQKLAEARPDFEFVTIQGAGHGPHVRDPVKTNLLIQDFLEPAKPKQRTWQRAMTRRTSRALYISSPIGLGHVQRDLAIARELRNLVPNLEIEWLAQPPVTNVLEKAGEKIHPLSRFQASESAHWEQSADEHGLHCFQAWREMDEIFLSNFMLFLEAVRETPYDLWIGDESWEVDYYLHENPELKTAPYVFLTDFLGWIPIDRSKGSHEAYLTADYNAEMIKQVARFPRVRDQALYVGDYEDIIPERFGPKLPHIADWTRENFTDVGYVIPFDPADYSDTKGLRTRLGYDPDQPLVFYAVGGTAVGKKMLHKAVDAWPLIHRERPEAHCIVVAGPRIDPDSLPKHTGMEVKGYVHNLFEHLAAADLGVVQGGLTTTMELTINQRPFIYFPLKNHCEQVYHVAYRLDRYKAGRRLDYAETSVESLAQAVVETLDTDTSQYLSLAPTAAKRAATLIAELL